MYEAVARMGSAVKEKSSWLRCLCAQVSAEKSWRPRLRSERYARRLGMDSAMKACAQTFLAMEMQNKREEYSTKGEGGHLDSLRLEGDERESPRQRGGWGSSLLPPQYCVNLGIEHSVSDPPQPAGSSPLI